MAWSKYANGKSTVLAGPSGKSVVVTYNRWGNKTRITDPDAGITNYTYNTFHELISQSDANGNVNTYTYDMLGRQLTMLRKKGSTTEHNVVTVYDSGAYAIGQVSSVEDKQTGFKVNYYYDTFARKRQQTTSFDLTSYQQHWSYDSLGRLQSETDATGGGLSYDAFGNRYKRVDTNGRYVGDKALASKLSSQSAAQSQVRFTLSDHLGSTHVIASSSGVKEQTMSFDVFGARRDAQSWAIKHTEASSGLLTSAITLKGYTGHEQIDDVGLVHMGGRVYDPILGRFLQADPFIQQPNNTQNLNRYSYVLNNPLNATDPSGYFFQMLVVWAVQYIAAATATTAIGTALSVALTAYSYYGYAQMAVGAIKAIEGGGTAMANFAGGVAKGYAKGLAFSGLMLGLTHLQNGVNKSTSSPDNAKAVEAKPGSGSSDGHTKEDVTANKGRNSTNKRYADEYKRLGDPKDVVSTPEMDAVALEALTDTPRNMTTNSENVGYIDVAPEQYAGDGMGPPLPERLRASSVQNIRVDSQGGVGVAAFSIPSDAVAIFHDHFQGSSPGPGAGDAMTLYRGKVNYVKDAGGNIYKIEFSQAFKNDGGTGWRLTTLQGRNLTEQSKWQPATVSRGYR